MEHGVYYNSIVVKKAAKEIHYNSKRNLKR